MRTVHTKNHGNRVVLHQLMVVFDLTSLKWKRWSLYLIFVFANFQDHSTLHARCSRRGRHRRRLWCVRCMAVIIINPIYAYMVLRSALFIFNTHLINKMKMYRRAEKKKYSIQFRSFIRIHYSFMNISDALVCQVNVALTPRHSQGPPFHHYEPH